jgi:hypothetical protein
MMTTGRRGVGEPVGGAPALGGGRQAAMAAVAPTAAAGGRLPTSTPGRAAAVARAPMLLACPSRWMPRR